MTRQLKGFKELEPRPDRVGLLVEYRNSDGSTEEVEVTDPDGIREVINHARSLGWKGKEPTHD